MAKAYDIVIIGAGSVGVPAALSLARAGLSVLVLDELASPGQLSNKKAIGGIRATHSDFGKIRSASAASRSSPPGRRRRATRSAG